MYEIFDHTADLGLHVRAPDLEGLFAEAGLALLSVLVEEARSVATRQEVEIALPAAAPADLLVDWLSELLFLFERRRLLLCAFDVRFVDGGLEATARGERCDPGRHRLEHEIKAITYHGLDLRQDPEGWEADVIVDI